MTTENVKLSAADTKAAMKAAHSMAQKHRSKFASYRHAFDLFLQRAYAAIRTAMAKALRRAAHALQVKASCVTPGNRIAFGTGVQRHVVTVDDVCYHSDMVAISWSHRGKDVTQRLLPSDLICKLA